MDDEDPDHGDGRPSGGPMVLPIVFERAADTSDDEMAGRHAEGTDDQDGLTSEGVNVHDGRDGGDEHDNTNDARSKQRDSVGAEAETVEDLGCI